MMHPYRRLIRYPLSQWRTWIVVLGLTASTSAVAVLQPWPMKILVDYALGDIAIPASLDGLLKGFGLRSEPVVLVVAAAAASLGLFVLNQSLGIGLTWAWAAAGQRMVYALATDLFYRLQRLSLLFHSRRSVGDALSRITGDTYCVYTLTDSLLITPAQHLLTLGAVGTVAWRMDPGLTLVSMAVAPVMAGAALFFGPRIKRRARLGREAQARLMSFVHQTLTAIPVVQAFGAERRNRRQFHDLAEDAVSLSQQGNLLTGIYGFTNGLITTLGTAVVLYAAGRRVLAGGLTVGSLLVFLSYLRTLQSAFRGLLGIYGNLKSAEAGIDRVLEVLDAEEEVKEAEGAVGLPELGRGERGHVQVEGVTFGYEAGRPVLHQVSLEARPGETVALVGRTGAGKSTLVSLIPRFFDPWEGRVMFDGRDVREVKLAELRGQVGFLLQDPFLLPLSVAENIAYGRPGASGEEVEAVARAANAHEFIEALPEGYETVIGERGATLSGGQKQRLAIARALLKDAAVLILDEPTSALDAGTEAQLLEALERLMAGRTTFIIAHRLSTIRGADRIVVLEGGRVVEMGSHAELLAAGGAYRRLHELQFAEPAVEALA